MFWFLDVVLAWGNEGMHSKPWLLSTFEQHQTSDASAVALRKQEAAYRFSHSGATGQRISQSFSSSQKRSSISAISNSYKLSCLVGTILVQPNGS